MILATEAEPALQDWLDLCDDGLLLLSARGQVQQISGEAARQLGLSQAQSRSGQELNALAVKCTGWEEVLRAVSQGEQTDCLLTRPDGRQSLATTRATPDLPLQAEIRLIVLRDLSGLDYRRDRALGALPQQSGLFLAEHHTRPDFAEQRRLSPELHRVLARGERAIVHGARILIMGESGVGKSEIAKFLHATVADADAPFVIANCAATSDQEFARRMFGDDRSAPGGRDAGLIAQSEGGTLFLDEVGEIPLAAQALLLRFLEDNSVTMQGSSQRRALKVRVIAATNRDLRQLVREGRFRSDLYYRLAVVALRVPPLRDMPALIDHLTTRFVNTINQRRRTSLLVPRRLREILSDYSFPGNIRELLNIVQKLAIFLEDTEDLAEMMEDLLAPMDIPGAEGLRASERPITSVFDLRSEVRRYERVLIDQAIRVHGSKRKAASALGVDIGTIVRKTAEPRAEPTGKPPLETNTGDEE
ncbi:sigma 54-interacting transcriptional regulator [Cypionkella sp.]|uniref:sigma 54-interacting transcriptional regulator n=1 Tax=Cypionkella sp. TaxID=2811411 RepID=UPI00274C0320|nr:sigma 54-interacting transcriptional regulator [Cypionkella sp.]